MSHPTEIQQTAEPTQRQVIDVLFRDRAVRAYTFTTLGALAMIFMVMFMNGSDLGGVLVVVFGAAALVLRWTATPPFLLLIIAYFLVFPFGIPDLGSENPYEIRETHFRVADVVLVMAILVYLRAQYRVFGFVHQIVPFENVVRRKGDVPTRRPPGHIRSDEIAWLIGIAGAIVIVGQIVWWLVNSLDFVPMEDFPFRWTDKSSLVSAYRRAPVPGEFRPGQNRFFLIIGGMFFGTLLLRLAFGYWQLRTMNAAEGAMILTDTSWAESHRERVRVEKWRIWGRQRAEEEAKRAEVRAKREEREREARRTKRRN
ncbi:unnamed protein product [Gemmata massiliana]|uniref:Uncharacterized protein n=1 Tax=Gemmata massiliana TaxID=1210884 RepID=A0A6P2CZF9_9BACT|nr:hypothetical protein [Gemmata massiliana]VTR94371.1 unnamed protein product [Gemmata massiliana]